MSGLLLEKYAHQETGILKAEPKKQMKTGLSLFAEKNFMLDMSSEHNFYTIGLKREILPHGYQIEGIIALNKKTDKLHRDKLQANGFILGDSKLPMNDPRVVRFVMEERAMELSNRNTAYSR